MHSRAGKWRVFGPERRLWGDFHAEELPAAGCRSGQSGIGSRRGYRRTQWKPREEIRTGLELVLPPGRCGDRGPRLRCKQLELSECDEDIGGTGTGCRQASDAVRPVRKAALAVVGGLSAEIHAVDNTIVRCGEQQTLAG